MNNIIIVLGCKDEEELIRRVYRAFEQYEIIRTSTAIRPFFILSGKYEIQPGVSEAKFMQATLLAFDVVSSSQIFLDEESEDTIENLQNSATILLKNFDLANFTTIISVCTSSYHIQRTVIVAQEVFGTSFINFICPRERVDKGRFEKEIDVLRRLVEYVAD